MIADRARPSLHSPRCPPENKLRPGDRIIAAVKVLKSAESRIALVVDGEGRLLGTITDGDVRRGLLRGVGLDSPVEAVMNPRPLTGGPELSRDSLLEAMRHRGVLYMPILDEGSHLIGLESFHRLENPLPERNNLVVVMAGGRGSRLLPLTENCPKPMLKVGGKPILQIILERFAQSGFSRFCITLNYLGDTIERYFGDGSRFGVEIEYLREQEPLGTAGALSLLRERPGEPLFLVNGDVLTGVDFESMLRFHLEQRADATMGVCSFDLEVPYGVVEIEGSRVAKIVEKPVHSFFVNAGICVFDPVMLDYLQPGRRLDVPDLVKGLWKRQRPVSVFPIHELWLDVGRQSDLERARLEFAATP